MEGEKKLKKVNIRRIIVLVVLAIFLIWQAITNRAEYLKIKGINENYTSIFFTDFYMELAVFGACFAITYILFYVNNKFIKKGMKFFFVKEEKEMPKLPNKSISLIAALIAGQCGMNFLYTPLITALNASSFGIQDQVFGRDLGFYIFILPFVKTLIIFLIVVTLIIIIYTAIYYVIAINVCFKNGIDTGDLKENTFVKQIKFWAIVFGILISSYIIVTAEDILTGNMLTIKDESGTELIGAGLTDTVIKLWGYRIFAIVVLISIIRIVKNASIANFRKCVISASIIPLYLVIMFGTLIYFQEVYVGSSELDKEKSYIEYNINATKEAFGIDIEQEEISEYETLGAEVAEENSDVLGNIPIISESIINQTISDTQDNSTYYNYSNTNLGVYNVNGTRKLLSLTAREIVNDSNRSYNNMTFEYTHGYSLVVADPSNIDENGYVEILQSSLDGKDNVLDISEPRIYFGLETDNDIIVNSSYGEEFDYPTSTSGYESNVYDGEAGLNLGFFDRLALGITSGNYSMILSRYLENDSKIITNRDVLERVKAILPYIKYDDNPYIVVTDDGELVWVVDGYTTSNEYPYSQSITITNDDGTKETINYIRNSVKVLVNAYSGETKFYITDRNDPIIMMYNNLYPNLFAKAEEQIPEDIQENLIYPQYLFDIQSQVIATYHDITEDMLYRADDIWSLSLDGESQIPSNYTMLKTNDMDEAELGLVVTYTKSGKGSLTSYLVGVADGTTNRLSLYKFSSDSNIIGVSQLNSLIEEDETISSELRSLEVSGVRVEKDVIIVPIENSILYIEPVYQVRLNEDETPVLKKIIVSSGNKVAIGDDLEEAITNLLSENNSVEVEYIDMEDINQVIDSIIEANQNLQESMDAQDLEMVGKDLETLQTLLEQLEVLRAQELEEQSQQSNDNNVENNESSIRDNTGEENTSNSSNTDSGEDLNTNTNTNSVINNSNNIT